MKIYFISNPVAGSGKKQAIFKEKLQMFRENHPNDEVILYETTGKIDATNKAKEIANSTTEDIMVFACGGDGTMYEVVNGIAESKNVIFGIVPTGSCNDFLKAFPDCDFFDLESQYNGTFDACDVLKVNEFYCFNICNIGFDAKVNYEQIQLRKKYKTVKKAYNHAIINNLLRPLGDQVNIEIDGKEYYNSKGLLMAFGNNQAYGGGYFCCPKASIYDGLIDCCIINKIGLLKFILLVNKYKKGLLYGTDDKHKFVHTTRGTHVHITSDHDLVVCLDGETIIRNEVNIDIIPKQIRFIMPKH